MQTMNGQTGPATRALFVWYGMLAWYVMEWCGVVWPRLV